MITRRPVVDRYRSHPRFREGQRKIHEPLSEQDHNSKRELNHDIRNGSTKQLLAQKGTWNCQGTQRTTQTSIFGAGGFDRTEVEYIYRWESDRHPYPTVLQKQDNEIRMWVEAPEDLGKMVEAAEKVSTFFPRGIELVVASGYCA